MAMMMKGPPRAAANKIFVGALPKSSNEGHIREYFENFGVVEDVKMMYHDSGEPKGYCFVTFNNANSAEAVFENYQSNQILGAWVDCKPTDGGKNAGGKGQMMNPMMMGGQMGCMGGQMGCMDGQMMGCMDGQMMGCMGGGGKGMQIMSAVGKGGKPGDWLCPACGDLVFARRNTCNMCGFSKGGGGGGGAGGKSSNAKPGDWVCSQCGDLVFSYKKQCGKCGTEKTNATGVMGVKKGDWNCPNCGDLVFGKKNICSMCGTPKPAEYYDDPAMAGQGSMRSRPY
mmetsp:Transcript_51607/g.120823  ORF Transcript_51607/g.120823 Transcript_51607/m.120823 type:complete len:284 (-) Transcript_51607:73-924(-)